MILGHRLQGMDVHYIVEDETALKDAMKVYTIWLDNLLEGVDQALTKQT